MTDPERQCSLPDAKLVVKWDQWTRMLKREALPEGEVLRIPHSLWLYRRRWINPGLAADHMCGLPGHFLYTAVQVGELEARWGSQKKVPRAYLQVGPLLAWLCEHRIRCDWRRWNNTSSYIRRRYSWPEPQ